MADEEEYTREELESMTVQELRDLLIENEMPTEGKKAELVDRLLGEDEEEPQDSGQAPVPKPSYSEGDVVEQAEVTRENKTAWWCPLCDHSMHKSVGPGETADVCAGCGSIREGNVVKRIARI